jgi:hypothetical protein
MYPQVEVTTFTNSYRRTFVDVQAAIQFAKQTVQASKRRISATVEIRGREVAAFDNRMAA